MEMKQQILKVHNIYFHTNTFYPRRISLELHFKTAMYHQVRTF